MPLKITYLTGHAQTNNNVEGGVISSESLTISGTSAQSGATPNNAVLISIYATEAACFDYSGSNPTAIAAGTGTSTYIGSGERRYLQAVSGNKVAGITAS
jgi:hypothetical protein